MQTSPISKDFPIGTGLLLFAWIAGVIEELQNFICDKVRQKSKRKETAYNHRYDGTPAVYFEFNTDTN